MSKNEMDLIKFINRAKIFIGIVFFIVGITASATTAWILQTKELDHLKEKLNEHKVNTGLKLKKIDEIQQKFQEETKASLYRIEDSIKEMNKYIYRYDGKKKRIARSGR